MGWRPREIRRFRRGEGGDFEPIRRFIGTALTEQQQVAANLVYWAYWLGELPDAYSSHGDMLTGGEAIWTGHRVLAHLLNHLQDPMHADLNAPSPRSLVLARPTSWTPDR